MRRVFFRVHLAGVFTCMNIILLVLPAYAFRTAQGGNYSIDTGGSIRTIGAGIRNYDDSILFGAGNDYDGSSQAILRLTCEGTLLQDASFEIHAVSEIFSTSADSAGLLPGTTAGGSGAKRYRISRGAWEMAEDDDFRAGFDTDRLNMKLSFPGLDITLGRQAVNFSQAYFYNPLDIFLAFDPEAFDRDYKPGVDAVRADFALDNFSALTFVSALGRELEIDAAAGETTLSAGPVNWYGSAVMARYVTTVTEWDIAFQAGKVYGGYQAGAGFTGEIREMGIRGEAAYVDARGDSAARITDPDAPGYISETDLVEDHFTIVIGTDYRFENSLYVNLEYLYNSMGENDNLNEALLRNIIGESLSLGKHLAGIQVSYEFHPLLTGRIAWIYSFSDTSSLVSPTFTYSVADEAEFLCGATLGYGERPSTLQVSPGLNIPVLRSEFGTYPDVFFMEFKLYF